MDYSKIADEMIKEAGEKAFVNLGRDVFCNLMEEEIKRLKEKTLYSLGVDSSILENKIESTSYSALREMDRWYLSNILKEETKTKIFGERECNAEQQLLPVSQSQGGSTEEKQQI